MSKSKAKIIQFIRKVDLIGLRYSYPILLYLLRDDVNMKNFPDLFTDYEEYHRHLTTFMVERAIAISKWIYPNSEILDLGIGDGLLANYLVQNKECKVKGIDISEEAQKKCNILGLEVRIKDLNQGIGLRDDDIYDYINAIEVLEHLIRPHVVLMEMLDHAKKGVIVTMPNSGYWLWRIQLLKGYFPKQSQTHLHFWTVKDFKLYCQRFGIEILDSIFLPSSSDLLSKKFPNFFAWQQCWLLKPKGKK